MPSLQKMTYTDASGRKRVKGYYATFRDATRSPQRKQISLGTKDASAARAKLARMELEYAQGGFDPWEGKQASTSALTAVQAYERFMRSRDESGSKEGVATYRAVVGHFIGSLPLGLLLTQVEARHVDAWLGAKRIAAETRKSYADRVRIFATWCTDEELAPTTWKPVAPAKRGKQARQETAIRFFTEEQLEAIIRTLDTRLILAGARASKIDRVLEQIIPFTAGTGLRRGEVCALRWSAVHVARGGGMSYVRVANSDGFTTKSGRERTVPLVGDALDAILVRSQARTSEDPAEVVFPAAGGGKMNDNYMGKRFRGLLADADVPGTGHHNFHSLRHTFGTMAVNRGIDVFQLKEVMGHADIKTTLKYAKLRPVALGQAMERAFGGGLLAAPYRESASVPYSENVSQ